MLTGKEEGAFLQKIQTGYLKPVRKEVITEADRLLTVPPLERKMEGRRLLTVSRTCIERVTNLAMAWRITKDSLYSDRAKAEMLAVASFPGLEPLLFPGCCRNDHLACNRV